MVQKFYVWSFDRFAWHSSANLVHCLQVLALVWCEKYVNDAHLELGKKKPK